MDDSFCGCHVRGVLAVPSISYGHGTVIERVGNGLNSYFYLDVCAGRANGKGRRNQCQSCCACKGKAAAYGVLHEALPNQCAHGAAKLPQHLIFLASLGDATSQYNKTLRPVGA